jgi:hypothetical protein
MWSNANALGEKKNIWLVVNFGIEKLMFGLDNTKKLANEEEMNLRVKSIFLLPVIDSMFPMFVSYLLT